MSLLPIKEPKSFQEMKSRMGDYTHKMDHYFDHLMEEYRSFEFFKKGKRGIKVNVSEDDKAYFVEAELPGITKADISLDYANETLIIKAKKGEKSEESKKNYHKVECSYGCFERSIYMPYADENQIDAEFKDGMLNIKLGKSSKATSGKKITIK